MKQKIDLNCDLGESYGAFKVGNDEKIMPCITSANVACGLHAGDPTTKSKTIALAKKHGVAVGAHPSYPDILGFGRREVQMTPEEVRNYTLYQVSALQGFAQAAGLRLQHVKPHGALYNVATERKDVAKPIVEAIKALDSRLIVFAPQGSALASEADKANMKVAREFFADRAYNPDGTLISRNQRNAIIETPLEVVKRAVKAVKDEIVLACNGGIVKLGKVHTVCVHGDNPAAVRLAVALRKGFVKAGIEVKPVASFL
jgi:UPF0271 protein